MMSGVVCVCVCVGVCIFVFIFGSRITIITLRSNDATIFQMMSGVVFVCVCVCVCVFLYSSDVQELRQLHKDATMQLFSR